MASETSKYLNEIRSAILLDTKKMTHLKTLIKKCQESANEADKNNKIAIDLLNKLADKHYSLNDIDMW